MYSFIYNILFIPFTLIFIKILAIFNSKVSEREKNWGNSLQALDKLKQEKTSTTIWFHAASMGEFEQAKPIIELIKEQSPDIKIICSFFSPSGYENQKNYKYADAIVYLPFDTKKNVKKFLDLVKPDLAVFIRYEIWRNFLCELSRREIKAFLICATKPGSKVLSTYPIFRSYTRSNYNLFSLISTVGQVHSDYFNSLNIKPDIITLTDTRFDRIFKSVLEARANPVLPVSLFHDEELVLVAGSTWEPDEDILIDACRKLNEKGRTKIRLILVPHEPTPAHIQNLQKKLLDSVLLSELNLSDKDEDNILKQVLIVDSIGKLLRLYSSADIAYVGGAFGAGVHSVTEAAGYGIPVITGPNIAKSHDAFELKNIGALKVVDNIETLYNWLNFLRSNLNEIQSIGRKASDYVKNSIGSSEKIKERILKAIED